MLSKINLQYDNDDFAVLPDGVLYRKNLDLQVIWDNGRVETWAGNNNESLNNIIQNFESMAQRWNETELSKQRREFNKFAAGYSRNIYNASK